MVSPLQYYYRAPTSAWEGSPVHTTAVGGLSMRGGRLWSEEFFTDMRHCRQITKHRGRNASLYDSRWVFPLRVRLDHSLHIERCIWGKASRGWNWVSPVCSLPFGWWRRRAWSMWGAGVLAPSDSNWTIAISGEILVQVGAIWAVKSDLDRPSGITTL
jgi:hypothetical protein